MSEPTKSATELAFESAPLPWTAQWGVVRDANGRCLTVIEGRSDAACDALADLFIRAPGMQAERERHITLLHAAHMALMSYQYGNSSPDLAKEIAEAIRAEIAPPVEIVTIDPGPVACRACGEDLVDGAGCDVCGDRYEEASS